MLPSLGQTLCGRRQNYFCHRQNYFCHRQNYFCQTKVTLLDKSCFCQQKYGCYKRRPIVHMRGAHRSADHQGVRPLWGAVCNITNSVGQNTNSVGQNTNSVGQNYILSTELHSVQQNTILSNRIRIFLDRIIFCRQNVMQSFRKFIPRFLSVVSNDSNVMVCACLTPDQTLDAVLLMGLPQVVYKTPFILVSVAWSNVLLL